MYLKRIVLHGFKSFADRTEFDFGPGLTMIVGPNGCGKSNILDAVRWVLGEQSARSLRGERMADVIFAGSRSRKPANAASVELTFDNRSRFLATDASEVSVGRVLYRNGDSEYRLNGQTCRLKDIRHLFLDTGVGVDAYSIIGQGRVDLLLQANPLERREIFEEAAGISRYKVQRTEAQRRLERTQNNLLRLNDVVDELEKRLRSVRLAASKARRWKDYDTRLRELRASFSLAEYHELECARRTSQTRSLALQDQLQAGRTELAACEAEAAEHEHAIHRLDEQLRAVEARLATLRSEHSALEERIAQGERRVGDLAAARDRRRHQSADFTERLAQLEQRMAEETATLQALIEAAQCSAGRVSELQQAHADTAQRRDDARGALERAKTAAFEAVRRSALLHNEQNNLVAQRDRLNAQLERLSARRSELGQEHGAQQQQRDAAAERMMRVDRQVTELTEALRQVDAQLAELAGTRAALEQEIGGAKELRSSILARLELLEDMERRREGVDQGTQGVLAWAQGENPSGGVVGLIADLLRIDDPRVWTLQPVLCTFENHVVVADTYAFLTELSRREELPGPVHVLALDRIRHETPRANYETAPGFVARAADWVRCPPECRQLAEHLLGRVIVVDVIERALALAANAPDSYVFVTLDGRTASVDGRLTVGAAQATPGLISRKSEIRQLRGRLDEIETQLERAARQRNELEQTMSDVQLRRGELLNGIAAAQKEHAEARTVLMRLEGEVLRIQREASVLDGESHNAQRALAEIYEQAERLQAESLAVGAAQQTHESQVAALARELTELDAGVDRLAQELTDAMVQAGRTAEKRAAGEGARAELQASYATLQRAQAESQGEVEGAARQIATIEEEVRAARARQVECQTESHAGQAEAMQVRERRQDVRQRHEACGARTREVNERLRHAENEWHECEMAQRETDVRQETLVARIRDDLGLDLAERYAVYEHTQQDWAAGRAEIEELRERIARLGNVNLDALTELEELSPRYENLCTQRSDLVQAIERLQTLIAELDHESRVRFTAAFEQIRANFQELFRKLFQGGKADVILEDPQQPLESGIDIIARPPGKEPQSISLLSGGEKTMTAVALLMAVFKSKPSPFAFLDEVDAALDEPNTERFNTLLQEFLSRSQFVVITHSKRTMQCGDVLYGVTMEEPGVSKRVSVRFEERVQTPSVA